RELEGTALPLQQRRVDEGARRDPVFPRVDLGAVDEDVELCLQADHGHAQAGRRPRAPLAAAGAGLEIRSLVPALLLLLVLLVAGRRSWHLFLCGSRGVLSGGMVEGWRAAAQ